MPGVLEAKPLSRYRLWLRFDDGAEGEVDLSGLAGRGVFEAWERPGFFEAVRIAPYGAIVWGEDLDLCADALYLQLTGKTPDQLFPAVVGAKVDA